MPRGEQILIADPDLELTDALREVFGKLDFTVAVSVDGISALERCRASLPDILLVEGMLPKMNGLELVKKVRALPGGERVKILLISAVYAGPKFRTQAEAAGVTGSLAKPFKVEDLLFKIQSMEQAAGTQARKARMEKMDRFSREGSLSETPFIRIVYHLYSSKATGTLRLQNDAAKKLIHFEDGEPKFIVSNLEKECLGRFLVSRGRLTEEQYRKSLDVMMKLKKRQGEVLIGLGLLDALELEETLKLQAEEKFLEIFSWRDGNYAFVPGKVFKKEWTPAGLNVARLCMRGVQERSPAASLQPALAPYFRSVPVLKSSGMFAVDDFKPEAWDMPLIRAIAAGKTVSDLLESHPERSADVYRFFFVFFMTGVIEFRTETA